METIQISDATPVNVTHPLGAAHLGLRHAASFASWLSVLAWMLLIFYLSETPRLAAITGSTPLFRLLPVWMWEWAYHGAIFGGLTALSYVAIRVSSPFQWQTAAWLSFVVAVSDGAIDEWHQGFVAGRSSDVRDIGRDALGAAFVVLLARVTEVAISHIAQRRWHAFVGLAGATAAVLESLIVTWLVALWMSAGHENAFSFRSLRPNDFETAIAEQPLALFTALPFLGVALLISTRPQISKRLQVTLVIVPALSAFAAVAVPFAVYVFEAIPDHRYVKLVPPPGLWRSSSYGPSEAGFRSSGG